MSEIERGTLQELATHYAVKQPQQVEYLTEESPVLASIKWEKASHGLWNVAEKVDSIKGADFVPMNSPLPKMGISSKLEKTDLSIMGGEIFVPEDTAQQFGGREKYFASKLPVLLKEAGNSTEKRIIYDNFRQYAIDNGNVINAGATTSDVSGGIYSMVVVHYIPGQVGGLYSPEGFKTGAILDATPINNGALYKENDILGYGVRLKGYFGIQMLNPKAVSAIVNIGDGKLPTKRQIDKALIDARANKANTKIFLHPTLLSWLGEKYKTEIMRVGSSDNGINTQINYWNEIEMISSYNFLSGDEPIVDLS